MRDDNPWPGVLRRLALMVALAALLGWLFGNPVLGVLLGSLGFLGWNFYQLARLERWLRRGAVTEPPKAKGLWGDVFDGLYRVQRRHRLRRKHLADLLQRFRESSNAMPDATVVLQDRGEMQWWNRAAKPLLGLRWPQDQGQRIDNLFRHPEFKAFLDADGGRDSITLPSPVQPRIVLELRIFPYGDGQRLLLARDITRLQRLERMRRDFVANVSHELRTPLSVIHGLAETLADSDEPLDPMTARSLALIQQQTQRMQRLVSDLLLLSRLETERPAAEPAAVNVPVMLEELIEEAKAVATAEQTITLRADSSLLIRGNDSELRSAFGNLIFNAVKYTPAGGRIEVHWQRDHDGARLVVRDTGIGIAAHHIPRLTERFYRVDASRSAATGGTGLGLAIVKHVLQRHDARLEIDSEPGRGSVFACRFPAAAVISAAA